MRQKQPISFGRSALLLCVLGAAALSAIAETVKITPIGSHDGELCRFDRALILEDPGGTRFLLRRRPPRSPVRKTRVSAGSTWC